MLRHLRGDEAIIRSGRWVSSRWIVQANELGRHSHLVGLSSRDITYLRELAPDSKMPPTGMFSRRVAYSVLAMSTSSAWPAVGLLVGLLLQAEWLGNPDLVAFTRDRYSHFPGEANPPCFQSSSEAL
jgi:hypothetical protein